MALETVTKYVEAARILLQDQVEPYRYPTADLCLGLSIGVLEARKLRADLFLGRFSALPSYTEADFTAATAVDLDEQYRMAFVYYICGFAQLRDEEMTQDARAAVFLNKFVAQLLDIKA